MLNLQRAWGLHAITEEFFESKLSSNLWWARPQPQHSHLWGKLKGNFSCKFNKVQKFTWERLLLRMCEVALWSFIPQPSPFSVNILLKKIFEISWTIQNANPSPLRRIDRVENVSWFLRTFLDVSCFLRTIVGVRTIVGLGTIGVRTIGLTERGRDPSNILATSSTNFWAVTAAQ